MLRDALALFAKTDLSRLDGSDVARFASILRDSAAFDARSGLRSSRRLARRGATIIAANPRKAGLGVGGIAALGLAGYAIYKLTRPSLQDERASVTDDVEGAAGTAKAKAREVEAA